MKQTDSIDEKRQFQKIQHQEFDQEDSWLRPLLHIFCCILFKLDNEKLRYLGFS